jgi:hypothetical protein
MPQTASERPLQAWASRAGPARTCGTVQMRGAATAVTVLDGRGDRLLVFKPWPARTTVQSSCNHRNQARSFSGHGGP